MLVGPKKLFVSIAHGVVRNFIVLAQLEEPLAAVRIIDGIESPLTGQWNPQSFQSSPHADEIDIETSP